LEKFQEEFSETNSMEFDITSDEKFHQYNVPLNKSAGYKGKITSIKIIPVAGQVEKGDWIKLKSAGF